MAKAREKIRIERVLLVSVIAARNLTGEDPYVTVAGGEGLHERTRTLFSNTKPFWGHDLTFKVSGAFKGVQFVVWNDTGKRPAFLGSLQFSKQDLPSSDKEIWYKLLPMKVAAKDFVSGDVRLQIMVKANSVLCRVKEAKGLACKNNDGLSNPFVKLQLGSEIVKTKVHNKTLNPLFDEEFELVRPSAGAPLKVEVLDHVRMGGNVFMGAININLPAFAPDEWQDGWYDLHDSTGTVSLSEEDLGDLQLKMKYSEDLILPLATYPKLQEFFVSDTCLSPAGAVVTRALCRVSSLCNDAVASSFVRVFTRWGVPSSFLSALVEGEVQATDGPSTIFRGNSLATKAADVHLRAVSTSYLQAVLQPFVVEILEGDLEYETDPRRLDDAEHSARNLGHLESLLGRLADAIFASAATCPAALKALAACIRSAVATRFPEDDTVRYTAVSGFVFLRFFCRAIMTPHLFGLCAEAPPPDKLRALTLTAKTLQNLASLAQFGDKESFMTPLNAFLDANTERMRVFLNALVEGGEDAAAPASEDVAGRGPEDGIDLPKELALMHGFLSRHQASIAEVCEDASAMDALHVVITHLNYEQNRVLAVEEQHVRDIFRRAIAPGIHRRLIGDHVPGVQPSSRKLSVQQLQHYKAPAEASPEKFRFVDRMRSMLSKGGSFMSHTKKDCRAVLAYCVLSQRMLFVEDQKKSSKWRSIPFASIVRVCKGVEDVKSSAIKKKTDGDFSCFLTIFGEGVPLCLECESTESCDEWHQAFEFLQQWQGAAAQPSAHRTG